MAIGTYVSTSVDDEVPGHIFALGSKDALLAALEAACAQTVFRTMVGVKGATVSADNRKGTFICQVRSVPTPTPDPVDAFVRQNGLEGVLVESQQQLAAAFGKRVRLDYEVFSDPSDGSKMLYVVVMANDLRDARRRLASFFHSWWYDRLAEYGDLLGFRIAHTGGL